MNRFLQCYGADITGVLSGFDRLRFRGTLRLIANPRGLTSVFACGLATDFCVFWSAMDARKAGFAASVIEDASRGIDAGGSLGRAWSDMTSAGVRRVQSASFF